MGSRVAYSLYLLVFLSLMIASCGRSNDAETTEGKAGMDLQITSTAFAEGGTIPKRCTCDGSNISPPLAWSGIPQGTESLALIMDDPDAPSGTFVHWVIYNIPATTGELTEAIQGTGTQGTNGARKQEYFGPCPPPGPSHRYFFKLYALDRGLELAPGASKAEVEKAMQGHILAQGHIMGRYGR